MSFKRLVYRGSRLQCGLKQKESFSNKNTKVRNELWRCNVWVRERGAGGTKTKRLIRIIHEKSPSIC